MTKIFSTALEVQAALSKINKKIKDLEAILALINEDFFVPFNEHAEGAMIGWDHNKKKVIFSGDMKYEPLLGCKAEIRMKCLEALGRMSLEAEGKLNKMLRRK